jgi:carboxymethylenebutenolidase
MTKDLSCPLIGIFGNDDRAPSPEQVNQHEAELEKHGKTYEFHRYDGAGHGIWYWHRPLYRPEQAMDGWSKVFAFFGKHLAK